MPRRRPARTGPPTVHRTATRQSRLGRPATAVLVGVVLSGCGAGAPAATAETGAGPAAVPAGVAGCEAFTADGAAVAGAESMPSLILPCLVEGTEVALDDLGGRPVLVNLWASWCAPCREEMPLLQDAYERYGDRVGFLGVNTEDSRAAAVSLLDDLGVTYAHVVDQEKTLLTELAVPGLPVTLAVAGDGRVVARQVGQLSAERLEELVTTLAADGPGAP